MLSQRFVHENRYSRTSERERRTAPSLLGGKDAEIEAYSDSDGMSEPDRRLINGYVFTLGGAISWSSKKADGVALSTTEAEYMGLTHRGKELL